VAAYIENSRGPNTDPCGTSLHIVTLSYAILSYEYFFLFIKMATVWWDWSKPP